MINHELSEPERDPFLDGLSLGVWNEEFGYYKPKTPEGVSACQDSVSKPISIISNVVEVNFTEPETTNNDDMKSGNW